MRENDISQDRLDDKITREAIYSMNGIISKHELEAFKSSTTKHQSNNLRKIIFSSKT